MTPCTSPKVISRNTSPSGFYNPTVSNSGTRNQGTPSGVISNSKFHPIWPGIVYDFIHVLVSWFNLRWLLMGVLSTWIFSSNLRLWWQYPWIDQFLIVAFPLYGYSCGWIQTLKYMGYPLLFGLPLSVTYFFDILFTIFHLL